MRLLAMIGDVSLRFKLLVIGGALLLIVGVPFAWQKAFSVPPKVEQMVEGAQHVTLTLPRLTKNDPEPCPFSN